MEPLPVNTWLQRAVRLAAESIDARIDRDNGDRPYFWYDLTTDPPRLVHDYWDFCDMSGRWVDALILCRLMTGFSPGDAEQRLKAFMLSRQKDDGLFYNAPCKSEAIIKIGEVPAGAFADMFCQGRILLGLVTWYLEEGSADIQRRIERMLAGLTRAMAWEGSACRAPAMRWLAAGQWQTDGGMDHIAPGFAATMAPLIMRYHDASGSPAALKLARGLVEGFVLDPRVYAPDGTYRGNTHWAGGLLAPAAAARIARLTGDDELLALCERIFENVAAFVTEFGWMPTDINTPEVGQANNSCEVCSLTDLVHLALVLIDAGAGDHWDLIDTVVRNQTLEQQFRRPEVLLTPAQISASDQPIAEALRGTWESWGMPNTLVGHAPGLEGCCTGAGVRTCYFAWQSAMAESDGRVYIHLPFSRAGEKLDILCHEPWRGAITLNVHQPCDVSLRIPKWVDPSQIAGDCVIEGRYLQLNGLSAGRSITIKYPLAEREAAYTIHDTGYRARWCGGTVVDMTPPGKPYPIYQNRLADLPTDDDLGCPSSPVVW